MSLLLAAAAGAAFAQREVTDDARSPEAKVPPVTYRSAFEDYRPHREQELASWRAVNEEVARVGGHAGVMKDGQASKPETQHKPAAGGAGMHR